MVALVLPDFYPQVYKGGSEPAREDVSPANDFIE
jgi:hypothetical protein